VAEELSFPRYSTIRRIGSTTFALKEY